jgi:bifunctional DNase/RNase
VITHFDDDIFYAVLKLLRDGETIDVDARPSDAIAVAVSFRPILPIWVSRDVFERFAQ